MASLYKRKDSPFWWIKAADGTRSQSTGFRHGLAAETRMARAVKAKWDVQETKGTRPQNGGQWGVWVQEWVRGHYASSPGTVTRYLGTWRTISSWMAEKDLTWPGQIRREHALEFLDWRKKAGHMNARRKTGNGVAHNTALMELKILSLVLTEAVNRGYIDSNPIYRLRIRKEPTKQKAELTPWHIEVIRAEIRKRTEEAATQPDKDEAQFLDASFEFALAQGCRLAETHRPLSAFDTDNMVVELSVKGRRIEDRPLSPDVLPLLAKWKAEGRAETYRKPRLPSLVWFKFMSHLRTQHPKVFDRVSFHATRVTVVSQLHRAGVPEGTVMQLVGHATATIHRIYRRFDRRELSDAWKRRASSEPAGPESPGSSGTTR